MGAFYNSNAKIIYQIINYIGIIAGVACVAMIIYACIKIFFSDEGEKNHYIKRKQQDLCKALKRFLL